ncbi:MAG TPA: GH1 family beta-glucosidase [Anaerolineales bacterium]|nr:GH1 family beta-glucosidase [Anaerolineales bacterium]
MLSFPKGFVWGAATAAYQIEGAPAEDGKGPSIWDTFTHRPGVIADGTNGDVACDHYHRWPEDVALMRALNLDAYRFSIAWTRIQPNGRGPANPAGLDFYSRLVDALLEAGITPYVTLYHWDLPQALEDEGGWLRRGIVDDYQVYADLVTRALGDRVKHWATFNEPWVFTWSGYALGEDAPGLKLGARGALAATHHALLAHGITLPLIRANVSDAVAGIVLDLNHVEPASDHPEDVAAARRWDGCQNRWYLDPLFKCHYPEDMLKLYGSAAPDVLPGDLDQICAPLDFLGVNFYRRSVVAAGTDLPPIDMQRHSPAGEYTEMGWEVSPNGLYDILKGVSDSYHPQAMYVTENGAAFADVVTPDGAVHDERRAHYLRKHFAQARQALSDGVPLKGYFVWSLLDNFEWACGFEKRFGVIYTDYATQRRIIKDSGHYLAQMAAS